MQLTIGVAILLGTLSVASLAVLRPGASRRDRIGIVGLALAVRVLALALVTIVSAAVGWVTVVPDEGTYLAEAQAGVSPSGYYSHLLGVLFRVTGNSAWLPRALNVIVGALVALVLYELVRHLAGRPAGVVAGVAVALWPSLVLWSALVLKDSLVLLAIVTALLGIVLSAGNRAWGLPLLVASTLVLGKLRPYAFVIVVGALLLSLGIVGLTQGLRRAGVTAVGVLAVGLVGAFLGQGFLAWRFLETQATVEQVDFARTQGAVGETGFARPGTDSLRDVMTGVPRGLLYTSLGPVPWRAEAHTRALLLVELPLWYGALFACIVSLWRRNNGPSPWSWTPMIAFAAGIVVVLCIYEGNAGTALRQRAMIIPVVVALASLRIAPVLFRARSPA